MVSQPPSALAQTGQPAVQTIRNYSAIKAGISIPAGTGKIEEFYQGKSKGTLVLVQDAHAIPEAQRNIRVLLAYFEKEYGIHRMLLEGASGILDARIFRSFPDKKILEKTLEEYTARGELSGGAAAAILNGEGTGEYRGMEDWRLYEQGLALFRRAKQEEKGLSARAARAGQRLDLKKKRTFSPALYELDRLLGQYENDHASMVPVLEKLASIRKPAAGSRLALLLEEIRRENAGMEKIEKELRAFAESKSRDMQSPRFYEKKQAFETSRISPGEFALFLDRVFKNVPQDIRLLAADQKKIESLEGPEVFRDFEIYAHSVKETLFRSEAEKKLDAETERLRLFKKLASLELSRKEWEELKARPFKRSAALAYPLAFYRNAERRELVFLENIEQALSGQTAAAAVAGGFHTQGLTAKCRERGISYLLITPSAGDVSGLHFYEQQLRGEVSWKNYLHAENGRINLNRAFIRAVRDKLLAGNPENGLLKEWRDQIIRDLAAREEITRLRDYAPYLDELANGDRVRYPWEERVRKFISNLKDLKAGGRLTEQNAAGLLKPGLIPFEFSPAPLTPGASVAATPQLPAEAVEEAQKTVSPAKRRSEVRGLEGRPFFDEVGRVISQVGGPARSEMRVAAAPRLKNKTASGVSPKMLKVTPKSEIVVWEPKRSRPNVSLVRPQDTPDEVHAKVVNEQKALEITLARVRTELDRADAAALSMFDTVKETVKSEIEASRQKSHAVIDRLLETPEFMARLSPMTRKVVREKLIPALEDRDQFLFLNEDIGGMPADEVRKLIVDRMKELLMIKLYDVILNLPYGFNARDEGVMRGEKALAFQRRAALESEIPFILTELERGKTPRLAMQSSVERARARVQQLREDLKKAEEALAAARTDEGRLRDRDYAQHMLDTGIEQVGYLESIAAEFDTYNYVYELNDVESVKAERMRREHARHLEFMEMALREFPAAKEAKAADGTSLLIDKFRDFVAEEVFKGRPVQYAAAKFFYQNREKIGGDFWAFLMRYYDIAENGDPGKKSDKPIIVFAKEIRNESDYNRLMGNLRGHGKVVAIVAPQALGELRIPHWYIYIKKNEIIPVILTADDFRRAGINFSSIHPGDEGIVDGKKGQFVINPDEDTQARWEVRERTYRYIGKFLLSRARRPAAFDGRDVFFWADETDLANLKENGTSSLAQQHGMLGIGLFRLEEMLTAEHSRIGIELDRKRIQLAITEILTFPFFRSGAPFVIRLFDVAEDKRPKFVLEGVQGPNPKWDLEEVMKNRTGVRFYLSQDPKYREFREFGKLQLKAIFGAHLQKGVDVSGLRMLFSDVRSAQEVREIEKLILEAKKEFIDEVRGSAELRESLRAGGAADLDRAVSDAIDAIPVGYMFEDTLAVRDRESIFHAVEQARRSRPAPRFIGIGSNDLTKSISKNRAGGGVPLGTLNPLLVRDIWQIAETAEKYGIHTTLEGEWGGSTPMLLMLLALRKYKKLDITPVSAISHIPELKEMVRTLQASDLERGRTAPDSGQKLRSIKNLLYIILQPERSFSFYEWVYRIAAWLLSLKFLPLPVRRPLEKVKAAAESRWLPTAELNQALELLEEELYQRVTGQEFEEFVERSEEEEEAEKTRLAAAHAAEEAASGADAEAEKPPAHSHRIDETVIDVTISTGRYRVGPGGFTGPQVLESSVWMKAHRNVKARFVVSDTGEIQDMRDFLGALSFEPAPGKAVRLHVTGPPDQVDEYFKLIESFKGEDGSPAFIPDRTPVPEPEKTDNENPEHRRTETGGDMTVYIGQYRTGVAGFHSIQLLSAAAWLMDHPKVHVRLVNVSAGESYNLNDPFESFTAKADPYKIVLFEVTGPKDEADEFFAAIEASREPDDGSPALTPDTSPLPKKEEPALEVPAALPPHRTAEKIEGGGYAETGKYKVGTGGYHTLQYMAIRGWGLVHRGNIILTNVETGKQFDPVKSMRMVMPGKPVEIRIEASEKDAADFFAMLESLKEKDETPAMIPDARSEMRADAAAARASMVDQINEPLVEENKVRYLAIDQTLPVFRDFKKALEEAPGMKTYFSPLNLDRLDLNLNEGGVQAQFPLAGGMTLTAVSLVRDESIDARTAVLKVRSAAGVEKIVGYLNYSTRPPENEAGETGPAVNLAFDIFTSYRSGADKDIPFSSAEVFLSALRMIRALNPDLSKFEILASGQLRDISVQVTPAEGDIIQIGSRIQNASFYLSRGFYPEGHAAEADAVLQRKISSGNAADSDYERLAGLAPFWILPVSRSEMRISAFDRKVNLAAQFVENFSEHIPDGYKIKYRILSSGQEGVNEMTARNFVRTYWDEITAILGDNPASWGAQMQNTGEGSKFSRFVDVFVPAWHSLSRFARYSKRDEINYFEDFQTELKRRVSGKQKGRAVQVLEGGPGFFQEAAEILWALEKSKVKNAELIVVDLGGKGSLTEKFQAHAIYYDPKDVKAAGAEGLPVDEFFEKTPRGYRLKAEKQARIRLITGDLSDPAFLESLTRQNIQPDFVFFRQVFQYLPSDRRGPLIDFIHGRMKDDGILYSGFPAHHFPLAVWRGKNETSLRLDKKWTYGVAADSQSGNRLTAALEKFHKLGYEFPGRKSWKTNPFSEIEAERIEVRRYIQLLHFVGEFTGKIPKTFQDAKDEEAVFGLTLSQFHEKKRELREVWKTLLKDKAFFGRLGKRDREEQYRFYETAFMEGMIGYSDMPDWAFERLASELTGRSEMRAHTFKMKEIASVNIGSELYSVAFSPDGKWIAAGDDAGDLTLINAASMSIAHTYKGTLFEELLSVKFSSDGSLLVAGNSEGKIFLLDMAAKEKGMTLLADTGIGIHSAVISNDKRRILSAHIDNHIRVFNPQHPDNIQKFNGGHSQPVLTMALSPDGQYLASAALDSTVRIWTPQGSNVAVIGQAGKLIRTVAFSPDSRKVLWAGEGPNITVRDFNAQKYLPSYEMPGFTGIITTIAYSPDSKYIAAGFSDGMIALWNADTRKLVDKIKKAHAGKIEKIDFSPNGQVLISGGDDAKVKVWSVPVTEEEIFSQLLSGYVAVDSKVKKEPLPLRPEYPINIALQAPRWQGDVYRLAVYDLTTRTVMEAALDAAEGAAAIPLKEWKIARRLEAQGSKPAKGMSRKEFPAESGFYWDYPDPYVSTDGHWTAELERGPEPRFKNEQRGLSGKLLIGPREKSIALSKINRDESQTESWVYVEEGTAYLLQSSIYGTGAQLYKINLFVLDPQLVPVDLGDNGARALTGLLSFNGFLYSYDRKKQEMVRLAALRSEMRSEWSPEEEERRIRELYPEISRNITTYGLHALFGSGTYSWEEDRENDGQYELLIKGAPGRDAEWGECTTGSCMSAKVLNEHGIKADVKSLIIHDELIFRPVDTAGFGALRSWDELEEKTKHAPRAAEGQEVLSIRRHAVAATDHTVVDASGYYRTYSPERVPPVWKLSEHPFSFQISHQKAPSQYGEMDFNLDGLRFPLQQNPADQKAPFAVGYQPVKLRSLPEMDGKPLSILTQAGISVLKETGDFIFSFGASYQIFDPAKHAYITPQRVYFYWVVPQEKFFAEGRQQMRELFESGDPGKVLAFFTDPKNNAQIFINDNASGGPGAMGKEWDRLPQILNAIKEDSLYFPEFFSHIPPFPKRPGVPFLFKPRFPAEEIEAVYVSGDFNNWKVPGEPMRKEGDLWKTELGLRPGRQAEYKYQVRLKDGRLEWVSYPDDPLNPDVNRGTSDNYVWSRFGLGLNTYLSLGKNPYTAKKFAREFADLLFYYLDQGYIWEGIAGGTAKLNESQFIWPPAGLILNDRGLLREKPADFPGYSEEAVLAAARQLISPGGKNVVPFEPSDLEAGVREGFASRRSEIREPRFHVLSDDDNSLIPAAINYIEFFTRLAQLNKARMVDLTAPHELDLNVRDNTLVTSRSESGIILGHDVRIAGGELKSIPESELAAARNLPDYISSVHDPEFPVIVETAPVPERTTSAVHAVYVGGLVPAKFVKFEILHKKAGWDTPVPLPLYEFAEEKTFFLLSAKPSAPVDISEIVLRASIVDSPLRSEMRSNVRTRAAAMAFLEKAMPALAERYGMMPDTIHRIYDRGDRRKQIAAYHGSNFEDLRQAFELAGLGPGDRYWTWGAGAGYDLAAANAFGVDHAEGEEFDPAIFEFGERLLFGKENVFKLAPGKNLGVFDPLKIRIHRADWFTDGLLGKGRDRIKDFNVFFYYVNGSERQSEMAKALAASMTLDSIFIVYNPQGITVPWRVPADLTELDVSKWTKNKAIRLFVVPQSPLLSLQRRRKLNRLENETVGIKSLYLDGWKTTQSTLDMLDRFPEVNRVTVHDGERHAEEITRMVQGYFRGIGRGQGAVILSGHLDWIIHSRGRDIAFHFEPSGDVPGTDAAVLNDIPELQVGNRNDDSLLFLDGLYAKIKPGGLLMVTDGLTYYFPREFAWVRKNQIRYLGNTVIGNPEEIHADWRVFRKSAARSEMRANRLDRHKMARLKEQWLKALEDKATKKETLAMMREKLLTSPDIEERSAAMALLSNIFIPSQMPEVAIDEEDKAETKKVLYDALFDPSSDIRQAVGVWNGKKLADVFNDGDYIDFLEKAESYHPPKIVEKSDARLADHGSYSLAMQRYNGREAILFALYVRLRKQTDREARTWADAELAAAKDDLEQAVLKKDPALLENSHSVLVRALHAVLFEYVREEILRKPDVTAAGLVTPAHYGTFNTDWRLAVIKQIMGSPHDEWIRQMAEIYEGFVRKNAQQLPFKTKGLSWQQLNGRSELRLAAESVISFFKTGESMQDFDAARIARIVVSRFDAFIPEVEAAVEEAVIEEDGENGAASQRFAGMIRGIERPVLVEYRIDQIEIGNMGKSAPAVIENLLQAAHDTAAVNKNISIRIVVPESMKRLLHVRDHHQSDSVTSDTDRNRLTFYHPGNEGKLGDTPVLVIGALAGDGTRLLSDRFGNNQSLDYAGSPSLAAQMLGAGLVWVSESLSKRTFDLLTPAGKPGQFRVKSAEDLMALRDAMKTIEEYRNALRVRTSA